MKEQFSKMDEENTGEKPVLSLKIKKKYSRIKKSAESLSSRWSTERAESELADAWKY